MEFTKAFATATTDAAGPIQMMLPLMEKKFFGRGIIQLSHCANYKNFQSYLATTKNIYVDLYNNPDLAATTYKWESGRWFFFYIYNLRQCGTRFGCSQNLINSIECGSATAALRYELFLHVAGTLGITTSQLSNSGCVGYINGANVYGV